MKTFARSHAPSRSRSRSISRSISRSRSRSISRSRSRVSVDARFYERELRWRVPSNSHERQSKFLNSDILVVNKQRGSSRTPSRGRQHTPVHATTQVKPVVTAKPKAKPPVPDAWAVTRAVNAPAVVNAPIPAVASAPISTSPVFVERLNTLLLKGASIVVPSIVNKAVGVVTVRAIGTRAASLLPLTRCFVDPATEWLSGVAAWLLSVIIMYAIRRIPVDSINKKMIHRVAFVFIVCVIHVSVDKTFISPRIASYNAEVCKFKVEMGNVTQSLNDAENTLFQLESTRRRCEDINSNSITACIDERTEKNTRINSVAQRKLSEQELAIFQQTTQASCHRILCEKSIGSMYTSLIGYSALSSTSEQVGAIRLQKAALELKEREYRSTEPWIVGYLYFHYIEKLDGKHRECEIRRLMYGKL